MLPVETLSRLITSLVFFGVGYLLSRKVVPPRRPLVWAALLGGLLAANAVGISTALISVFGFVVSLDALLEGIGFGIVAGFVMRTRTR